MSPDPSNTTDASAQAIQLIAVIEQGRKTQIEYKATQRRRRARCGA